MERFSEDHFLSSVVERGKDQRDVRPFRYAPKARFPSAHFLARAFRCNADAEVRNGFEVVNNLFRDVRVLAPVNRIAAQCLEQPSDRPSEELLLCQVFRIPQSTNASGADPDKKVPIAAVRNDDVYALPHGLRAVVYDLPAKEPEEEQSEGSEHRRSNGPKGRAVLNGVMMVGLCHP